MSKNLTLANSINIVLTNAHLSESSSINPKYQKKRRKNQYSKSSDHDDVDKASQDIEDRPDIIFFSLLALQDSIVNIKKFLNLYIVTKNGTLIKVYNTFRVPRTYKLFLKVMDMLFNSPDRVLKASGSEELLLEVLKGSIDDYISDTINVNVVDDGYLVDFRKFLANRSHAINNSSITFYINAGPFRLMSNNTPEYIEDDQIAAREEYLLNLIENGEPKESKNVLNITLSRINITASAKCSKLICDIEAVFNL